MIALEHFEALKLYDKSASKLVYRGRSFVVFTREDDKPVYKDDTDAV